MADADADSDGMNEIGQLLNDYTSLQAAHQSLIERCDSQAADIYAEVQGEMESLRGKVSGLEADLAKAAAEKEELSATVRDLRVRVEESRRAIMRLQGSNGSSSSSNGQTGMTSASGSANANRRSMGPAALSSWNPRETVAANNGTENGDDTADLKKSKRASLAFGPNAQATIARRVQGHRRIASGSKIGQNDDDGNTPNTANSQGLRELHLGGSSAQPASGYTSKRSSYLGGMLSPASENGDSVQEGTPTSSSLLMPARPNRRASNGSSISGSARDEGESGLAVPGAGRSGYSPSSSSKQLSIQEAEEGGSVELIYTASGEDNPATARPKSFSTSVGSSFSAMQQADYQQLQRMLAEQKYRVNDRDGQIEDMRREMNSLRLQLDDAKEARIASEACLKALRDFVKDEGGSSTDTDGGAGVLKGVKLPPLPTDQDTDDMSGDAPYTPNLGGRGKGSEVLTPTQAAIGSTWKSIGSTFAGLSRTKSGASDEILSRSGDPSASPEQVVNSAASAAPLSPAANIGASIGNLWVRSTAPRKRDSVSTVPSDGNTVESRHTSTTSFAGEPSSAGTMSPPPSASGLKGFAWFSKRTVSGEVINEGPQPINTRVSSPPFANLDHNVITLDQIPSPTDRKVGRAESAASQDSPISLEPNGRARKAKEKSDVVDEDTGFVPPVFESS